MDPVWAGVGVGAAGVAVALVTSWMTLAHARKTSEHELRAYVFLKDAMIEMIESRFDTQSTSVLASGRVSYQYVNSGKTPAKSVFVAARALWRRAGEAVDEKDVGPFRNIGPIGPADGFNEQLEIEGAPEPKHIWPMVESANCEIHLIGRIRYADEWSEERETSFHYYIGDDAGWDEEMTAATSGNDYR